MLRALARVPRVLKGWVSASTWRACCLGVAWLSFVLAGCDARGPVDDPLANSAVANPGTQAGSPAVAGASATSAAVVRVAATRGGQTRAEVYESVRKMTALGKQMFFDPSLSGSGKLSCASCHSPEHAFTPANPLAVQLGGSDMRQPGMRAVPTLKYLQSVPAFTEHFHDSEDEGDESVDAGPTGGLTWDGRVDRGSDQARIPILSTFEMGSTPEQVTAAVKAAPYSNAFRAAFGEHIFDDPDATFKA